jgi:hypothetical protein
MLVVAAVAWAVGITNGGFETGNFAGWTQTIPGGATQDVVTSDPNLGAPAEGRYYARLKTDGPDANSRIEQSVALPAGSQISGYAQFYDTETAGGQPCFFADTAEVQILDSAAAVVATPFFAQHCTTNSVPWTLWSYTVGADDTYTIRAQIRNIGDSAFDSLMGVDGVLVSTPCEVSGGGFIAGTPKKNNFGIDAEFVTGVGTSGTVNYHDKNVGIHLIGDTILSVFCDGNDATILGSGTVGGSPVTFRVDVTDNGEPGTADTFAISISTGYSASGTLGGGNIQVEV